MRLRFCITVALLLLGAGAALAQVPRSEDAELFFQQGLQAFEQGDYGMAYRRFRLVYADNVPLNRKTTAAHLMAGKSLYRSGQYQEAADLLGEFVRRYPTSGYVDDARETQELALQQLGQVAPAETMDVGIILPLGGEHTARSQAMFNGIRLAVDEQNEGARGPRLRMVFRDTQNNAREAAEAVRELAAAGVRVVIGPLYSPEARAAATAAEEAGVVLVAPLANDEDVADGKRFVFQANPTIVSRGELMAQYAQQRLGLRRFGVVAENDAGSISERMGEGFERQVVLQGGALAFYRLLDGSRGWGRLETEVGADTMALVEAVYLPVSGGRAATLIEQALTSLDRMGATVQVLGNDEWHNHRNKALASRFRTTYTTDFFADPARAEVKAFEARYNERFGSAPDPAGTQGRLAYTGYDLMRFLLTRLAARGSGSLADALRAAPPYQGLGLRVDFQNGNVNRAFYVHQYRDGQVELVE